MQVCSLFSVDNLSRKTTTGGALKLIKQGFRVPSENQLSGTGFATLLSHNLAFISTLFVLSKRLSESDKAKPLDAVVKCKGDAYSFDVILPPAFVGASGLKIDLSKGEFQCEATSGCHTVIFDIKDNAPVVLFQKFLNQVLPVVFSLKVLSKTSFRDVILNGLHNVPAKQNAARNRTNYLVENFINPHGFPAALMQLSVLLNILSGYITLWAPENPYTLPRLFEPGKLIFSEKSQQVIAGLGVVGMCDHDSLTGGAINLRSPDDFAYVLVMND